MSRGRPTKMTDEMLGKLELAFTNGLSDREACLYANINPSTLYEYCEKNKEFSERKELLKEQPKMIAKMNIKAALESGDKQTSQWYLERKAKDEFSSKQEVEQKSTIDITNPFSQLSVEVLEKLAGEGNDTR